MLKLRAEAVNVRDDRPREPQVEVDDIQGDAISGFNKPHMAVLALDIADNSPKIINNTKKWLADYVIPKVTSARDVIEFRHVFRVLRERLGQKPTSVAQVCLSISFSYDGLLHLANQDDVKKFNRMGINDGFQYGLPARSGLLNDPGSGEGAVKNWKVGANKNPHILIQIASDQKQMIQTTLNSLKTGLSDLNNPVKITYEEFGKRRDDLYGHEHFGFKDGISSYGIRGTFQNNGKPNYVTPRFLADTDPRAHHQGLPGQLLLWPGELILGYPKQNSDAKNQIEAEQPGSADFAGPEWAKNGTFLVFRRLKQDVPKFWKFMKESAETIAKHPGMCNFTDKHMGAKVMARWLSGAPIMRTPNSDLPSLGNNPLANNAFLYTTKEDPHLVKPDGKPSGFPEAKPDILGMVCPFAGHLRKVQPRDQSTDVGVSYRTREHMIIRRGIEYGDPIKNVMVPDGKDRGLFFVCYQKSIDKHFEFIVTTWANRANAPKPGGHDMVIGQSGDRNDRERTFDVPLESGGKVTLKTKDEWVIPTGGGYFFVPSISALKDVIAKIN